MSFAELKETVRELPAKQRRELASLIDTIELASDPKWRAEMLRRKHEMAAGNKFSREEVMRLCGITEADIR